VTADRRLVLVRQYRHILKSCQLEFPAGTMHETEDPEVAARREMEEETGFTPTHVFLASPVEQSGPARLDIEIEEYFDTSVVLLPVQKTLDGIGTIITSMESVGALMAARTCLP
jgi:ADP-ribose pyrophosphatase